MAENKMVQVARIFGKKLGESFTVRIGTNIASACAFKNNGLFCEGRPCEIMLWDLLIGQAEITEDKKMTKEQEDRLRCINGALTVLRVNRDGILEKEPDNEWGKMLDSTIHHIETMTREWAYAIGHPVDISNETIADIVKQISPIIVNEIKRHRGGNGND